MGYCVCCVGGSRWLCWLGRWLRWPMVVFGGCVGSADGWARPMVVFAEDEESVVYKEQMGEKKGAEVKENDVKGKGNQEKGRK